MNSKAVVAVLTAAASMPALGQQAQDTIEEVMVTAQRRAQSAQAVPLAVTAISAEELERRGYTEAFDVVRSAPVPVLLAGPACLRSA